MRELTNEMMRLGGQARIGNYRLTSFGSSFVTLVHSDYDKGTMDMNGWKFHISLNENDNVVLLSVYKEISQILIEHGVLVSKFKKFGTTPDGDSHPSERGRQATIYATPDTLVDWKTIFEMITRVLIDNNIAPGYPNPVCKAITGSNYISYRNDLDAKGEYISCRQAYADNDIEPENKYNPGRYEDPFMTLSIEVDNQLERQDVDAQEDGNSSCCCRIQ